MPRSPKQDENLKKGKATQFRAGEEQAEIAKKGGKASAAARAARKTLREELEALLSAPAKDKKTGKEAGTVQTAVSTALIQKAMKGDVKAFVAIRDTVGEKPVDHVMISEVDPQVVAEVEKMVTGNDEE